MSSVDKKTILSVDVQPAYRRDGDFDLAEYVDMLRRHDGDIFFMYNEKDLSGDTQEDIISWLKDEGGMEEALVTRIHFIEKDYGWLRPPIDCCMEHEDIVQTLKVMIDERVSDSRDFEEDEIDSMDISSDMKEFLLEFCDPLFLPHFMPRLEKLDNFILVGGGAEQCLLEVKLLLDAMDKRYVADHKFIYGGVLGEPIRIHQPKIPSSISSFSKQSQDLTRDSFQFSPKKI